MEISTTQFWWNWWVSLTVAAGTIGAVIVALFGQAFRAKFFPAKLKLDLVSADGELTNRVTNQAWRIRPNSLLPPSRYKLTPMVPRDRRERSSPSGRRTWSRW